MAKSIKPSSHQPSPKKERLISDKRIKSIVKVIFKLLKDEVSFQGRIKSIEEKKVKIIEAAGTFTQANLSLINSKFTALSLSLKKLQAKIAAKKDTLSKYVETNNRINGLRLGSANLGE